MVLKTFVNAGYLPGIADSWFRIITKSSFKVSGVPAAIRNGHFQNTRPEFYRYTYVLS